MAEKSTKPEKQYLLEFAANHDLSVIRNRLLLRSLWSAYCLHQNLWLSAIAYETEIRDLWDVAKSNWPEDFGVFYSYLNTYLP